MIDVQGRSKVSARASAWGRAGSVAAAVVAADQLTKALVRHGIDAGQERSVLPGVQLVHVSNKGVAFGFLSGGGAIGNLIDRIAHGQVTDFIKVPLWPAFNVADISITFGVLALLYALEGGPGRDGD